MGELIEALNNFAKRDWFDIITLVLSILSLLASAIFTALNIHFINKNTTKQIENQNKETYKPRLRLKSMNNYKGPIDQCLCANANNLDINSEILHLYIEMELENIGNGLANNISFYVLNNGFKCNRFQNFYEGENQFLASTIEIPKDNVQKINFSFNFDKKYINNNEVVNNKDFILLLCNYKDLNNNDYKLIIGFILKGYVTKSYRYVNDETYNYIVGNYNYYYYQEDTLEYDRLINMDLYKDKYQNILNIINNDK